MIKFLLETTYWYFLTLIISFAFLPLCSFLFGKKLYDNGYAFARTLSIILLSYLVFATAFSKLLPFTKTTIIVLLIFYTTIIWYNFKKQLKETFSQKSLKFILFYEFVFFSCLLFMAFIRSQNPSILDLEKFMDFGFVNSILRSKYFPPKDIWIISDNFDKPYYINYYYFGHLTTAVLTKLSGLPSYISYNLMIATIFALSFISCISIAINLVYKSNASLSVNKLITIGILTSALVNLGGNYQLFYIFTKGYNLDEPPPPIWDKDINYSLGEIKTLIEQNSYNPILVLTQIIKNSGYWFATATRFIPFTIHEFPSYSYIVSDLHGHLLNLPNVLLILGLSISFFLYYNKSQQQKLKYLMTIPFGFLIAVGHMTNASDTLVYLGLLFFLTLFLLKTNRLIEKVIFFLLILMVFSIISLPFNVYFISFVKGIGINCPNNLTVNLAKNITQQFNIEIYKVGPFIIEPKNCQRTLFWMFIIIWGHLITYSAITIFYLSKIKNKDLIRYILILIPYNILLILFAEFFYFKDIYPTHFRANTLFKLGYQAYIMLSLISSVGFYYLFYKTKTSIIEKIIKAVGFITIFIVLLYSVIGFPSIYGNMNKEPDLDGRAWMKNDQSEKNLRGDLEIIDFLNKLPNQPHILEASGDSYTEYERISAYTGLPTLAGWLVHEWLWRDDYQKISQKVNEVKIIYTTDDLNLTRSLLKKYQIEYVIVNQLEREKYPELNEEKFQKIGKLEFVTTDGLGRVYKIEN
ncbi:MAG: hypothetical protein KatS3mg090_0150 [Patescibacteria group bacterium]|nr:MAG: hypothetical protein KatS3mg090_0150 [Patescibacteria group bacterium]